MEEKEYFKAFYFAKRLFDYYDIDYELASTGTLSLKNSFKLQSANMSFYITILRNCFDSCKRFNIAKVMK